MMSKINPRLKQQELANYALSIGNYYQIELDFSERSIKKVDDILSRVRKQYDPKPDASAELKEDMYGIALEMGAYIIEVIERVHGTGKWDRDDPDVGQETWPFTYGNITIFPVEWCLKRIYGGRTESVARKYKHVFLRALKNAQGNT